MWLQMMNLKMIVVMGSIMPITYPKMDGFFQKKSQYDPDLILMNQFYENYPLSTGN